MKIFDNSYPHQYWQNKTNFVDKNNVVLGYDLEDQCCEYATWQLVGHEEKQYPDDIEEYIFDTEYLEGWDVDHTDKTDTTTIREFKLMAPNKEPLYLRLSNCHNGYYCHGFVWSGPTKELIQEKI